MRPDALMFMARPGVAINALIDTGIEAHGLDRLADGSLFPNRLRHQSLSRKFDLGHREALLRVGASIRACAFDIVFNRIGSNENEQGRIHWTLLAKGEPVGFGDLLTSIQQRLARDGIQDGLGHSPHITLNYAAPMRWSGTLPVTPMAWTVEAFELVVAGGDPYGYKPIATWKLAPPMQGSLL